MEVTRTETVCEKCGVVTDKVYILYGNELCADCYEIESEGIYWDDGEIIVE